MKDSFDIAIRRKNSDFYDVSLFDTVDMHSDINVFVPQDRYGILPFFNTKVRGGTITLGNTEQVFDLGLYGHTLTDYIECVPSILTIVEGGSVSLSESVISDAEPSYFVISSDDADAFVQVNLKIDEDIQIKSADAISVHSDINANANSVNVNIQSPTIGLFVQDILPSPVSTATLSISADPIDISAYSPIYFEASTLTLGCDDVNLHTEFAVRLDSDLHISASNVTPSVISYISAEGSSLSISGEVTASLREAARIYDFGELRFTDFNEDDVCDYLYIDESLSSFDSTTI